MNRGTCISCLNNVYYNEHLTHSCLGMPQGIQALSSSFFSCQENDELSGILTHFK